MFTHFGERIYFIYPYHKQQREDLYVQSRFASTENFGYYYNKYFLNDNRKFVRCVLRNYSVPRLSIKIIL